MRPPPSTPVSQTVAPSKFRRVLHEVADKHQLRAIDIADNSLKAPRFRTPARHEVMWRLRQMGHSYPAIARVFGLKDHTTILNGVRRHEERMR